jgi:hypothetical protein
MLLTADALPAARSDRHGRPPAAARSRTRRGDVRGLDRGAGRSRGAVVPVWRYREPPPHERNAQNSEPIAQRRLTSGLGRYQLS